MGDFVFKGDVRRIARIAAGLHESKRLNLHIAEEALPVFERNLVSLAGSNRNRFGARGGFWNRMLSGTKAMATAEAAIVRMPREVRLRHKGGTVTAKKAKFLAIPVVPEAYGKSPRQFTDLHVVVANSKAFLVRRPQSIVTFKRDRRSGVMRAVSGGTRLQGTVMYILLRSATIRPNPAVLPPTAEIQDAAGRGARKFIKSLTA